MPIEKTGFIDEVLDDKVVQAIGIWQDFGNLLKGGKRGPDHVEQHKVEFAGAAQVEEPDVREGLESGEQRAGTHVDDADFDLACGQRIEHLHLVGRGGDIDQLGHLGKESLEGSSRKFGVEGACLGASGQRTGDKSMKPVVFLVGADKGGVGKTTIVRTLLDYLPTKRPFHAGFLMLILNTLFDLVGLTAARV